MGIEFLIGNDGRAGLLCEFIVGSGQSR